MNQTVIYFLLAIISLAIGIIVGHLIARLKQKAESSALKERLQQHKLNQQRLSGDYEDKLSAVSDRASLQEEKFSVQFEHIVLEREGIRKEKDFLNVALTRRNSEFESLESKHRDQQAELEKLQEKFTKEFENLANKILDSKSEKFTEQNKKNIDAVLKPLQEKIDKFEKRVDDTHKESLTGQAMLRQQIIGLKELNEQMSKEATNLTKALKGDSKIQGNWGELVLEKVLEKSGLEKDREYFVQQSFTLPDGKRVLPDVVIHLPDNKRMIIDSKVSLVAYERFVNEEDDIQQARHLNEHLASLKRHVDQLSEKNYHDLYEMESPDFVLLFVPIEPAFAIAINKDPSIYNKAFEQNIIIVTPSTLLATLRTIDTMWNNEKQQRNAIEISRQAGALYDKFEGLIKDLTGVGKKMDDAKTDYSSAMNKLFEGRGNLITSVEKLKKMGAKAKKSLPEKIIKRAEENNELE
ncbi:MAG: DNA recombination protein RmuC [Planctomycetota bacterium]|uniref:DNA recombination protein RmuC n=1 Tax=Patiriisocius sp. Uisw_047 TaxID=3230969 RepID=UPI0039E73185